MWICDLSHILAQRICLTHFDGDALPSHHLPLVMRPILLPPSSVNQRLPSGPAVIPPPDRCADEQLQIQIPGSLEPEEMGVGAIQSQQLLMSTILDDLAVFDDQNTIGHTHR
jgi:hypothetical protein